MFVARNIFLTTFIAPSAPSFTGMVFNNCNQTGRNGPNFTTCDNYYQAFAGSSAQYPTLTNFAVNFGYQSFDIPAGTYSVTMDGTCGGSTDNTAISGWNAFSTGTRRHARGARATFTLTVTSGLTLTMVIGQKGGNSDSTRHNPGGGGGTFLVAGTYAQVSAATSTDELICAVGGGGGYNGPQGGSNNYTSAEGQTTTSGLAASGAAGTNGNGAAQSTFAANSSGGAGYFTNSSSLTGNGFGTTSYQLYAWGFRNGAVGAQHAATDYNSRGGFGGGGGGSTSGSRDEDKGGGGGYSGGGYAFDAYNFGGGGGSIINSSGTGWSTSGGSLTRGGGAELDGQIIFS